MTPEEERGADVLFAYKWKNRIMFQLQKDVTNKISLDISIILSQPYYLNHIIRHNGL